MSHSTNCPFCSLSASRVLHSTSHGRVLRDAYPVSDGHALVVPHRHVASLWDLTAEERAGLWALVDEVREALAASHGSDDFNIGVNDGKAAGQTVSHAHIHVIPRYAGDVADPRGGIRWVVPERAAYWEAS